MSTYKIGERVKFISDKLSKPQWITGCIVYETNNGVSIKYDSHWAQCIGNNYEWLNHQQHKIQPLDLESMEYIKVSSISKVLHFQEKPTYFKSRKTNKDYLIMITAGYQNKINLYDISCKHYQHIGQYPADRDMKYILDKQHELLYVFDTKNFDFLFQFDLNHKKWNVKFQRDGDRKYESNTNWMDGVFVDGSINEIHTVHKQTKLRPYYIEHKKYDDKVNKFVTMSKIYDDKVFRGDISMFYIDSLQQMFVFRGSSIFYCHIKEKDQTKYLWKKSPIILPRRYNVVLVHDHIAIIYPYDVNEIYCVDLLYHKSAISNKRKPKETFDEYLVADGDHFVHCIGRSVHYKWCLNEVIPKEIQRMYRKSHTDPLVIGYIKKEEQRLKINFPFYLKQIVIAFCPYHFDKY